MTREFWVWQWADGEFGSFIWPSKDSATLPHRHEVGHPIQLVPKAELEAAQKDATRYRELKDHRIEYKPAGYDGRNVGRFDLVWEYQKNDLDEAIDAAIAAQEK